MRICEHCCKEFKPKRYNRLRFCSRECSFAYYTKQKIGRKARVAADLQKRQRDRQNSCAVYFLICQGCSGLFASRTRHRKYCSSPCHARAFRIAGTQDKRQERQCPECLLIFTPKYGRAHSRYCTNECARRNVKRVSRAAGKAMRNGNAVESVNPLKVFDRDKWQCQLCGEQTPPRLRATYDLRSPELDHIVPLSAGGEHSYRNTQCSCRGCNMKKGARPLGQMRLFG